MESEDRELDEYMQSLGMEKTENGFINPKYRDQSGWVTLPNGRVIKSICGVTRFEVHTPDDKPTGKYEEIELIGRDPVNGPFDTISVLWNTPE